MDLSLLLAIQAFIFLIVGLAFLLVPRQYVAPFEMRIDDGSVFFARLVGSAYLAIAALDWLSRGSGRQHGCRDPLQPDRQRSAAGGAPSRRPDRPPQPAGLGSGRAHRRADRRLGVRLVGIARAAGS